jgi:hypothetical protein
MGIHACFCMAIPSSGHCLVHLGSRCCGGAPLWDPTGTVQARPRPSRVARDPRHSTCMWEFGVLTINAPQLGMRAREHSQLRLGSRVKSSFEHSALPFSNVKVCWFSPLATTPAFLLILNVSSRHHRRMEWTTDASSMSPATCAKYPQRPVSVRSEAPARTRHLMIQQRHNLVVWM